MQTLAAIQQQEDQYEEIAEVGERPVRATHTFLSEADIGLLKTLVHDRYFYAVSPNCAVDERGSILWFVTIADTKIEMLFIDANIRGKGIGRALLNHAIIEDGATKVDVNEQNPERPCILFKPRLQENCQIGTEGQGKPFPLLQLQITDTV